MVAYLEEFLRLMSTCKVSPPEKIHNWGKMLVSPKKGESLLSWIMRQAWAFGITPKRLIQSEKEYWLLKENISLSSPKKTPWLLIVDVLPVQPAWDNIFQQRGLNVRISELQLDISIWFDLTNKSKIAKTMLRNYYNHILRYCPLCWKNENERYFKALWRLPFVIVCPEHGVELKESCFSCEEILFSDKSQYNSVSVVVLDNFKEEWLVKCRHCNHSILEEVVEERTDLAELQSNILNNLLSDSNWGTPSGYLIFWHTYQANMKKQKLDHVETCLKLMEAILEKPPGVFGLELAQIELMAFNAKYGRLPKSKEKEVSWIFEEINNHEWVSFGIKTWNDLIRRTFGEVNNDKGIYMGEEGLQRAINELLAFKTKHYRLPTSMDTEMVSIVNAIEGRHWISYGIKTWNDLLRNTFGELNRENGKYTGEQGLNRGITELKDFKIKHIRLPRGKEMRNINEAVKRGEWTSFGIKTWNDLLRNTFGELNRENGKYTGEQGLNRGITELQDFKIKHSRLPNLYRDKEMTRISDAIRRGKWTSFGIKKWNDLLMKTFGAVNRKMKDVGEKR